MFLNLGLSWELVYSGPAKEHVSEGLKPGCSYQTRVYCMSEGGQSAVSHSTSAHMHNLVLHRQNSITLNGYILLTGIKGEKMAPFFHNYQDFY